MKAFFDFVPVLLFFLTYIFYADIPISYIDDVNNYLGTKLSSQKSDGIYFATLVLMVTYSMQFIILFFMNQAKKIHYITLGILIVAGISTLYFKNPLFIKIKPSIVYWGFALFFILNQMIGKENIIKRLLQEQIELDDDKWKILSNSWIIFFLICGFLNLYVASYFSEEKWVEFKFYILGIALPIAFIVLNGIYIGSNSKK